MDGQNKVFILVICCLNLIFISGCSIISESDIRDVPVILIAPSDGVITSVSGQTFCWNYVDEATNYNLQIVSPGFDYIEKLVLDTALTSNKFSMTLDQGVYEWRVNAYNSGYQTQYTAYKLEIENTNSPSDQ